LRTPDGGVTDVVFERGGDTGSVPLVSADGEVRIADASPFSQEDATETIADAITEALSTPMPPMRVVGTPAVRDGEAPAQDRGFGRPHESTPRGGVGIGLPYTGPQGQVVFGPPEQRLVGASTAFGAANDSGVARSLEPDARASTVVPHLRRWLWVYV